MDARKLINDFFHVIILLSLIMLLLGILTWTGIIKCGVIPFWCEIYWGVTTFATGGPKVLIVYGDSGLGNPIGPCNENSCSLQELMANPEFLGVHADTLHISRVNSGNLRPYAMVIVERARQIPTDKLRAFIDYYNAGGRLVWTGDAGAELGESMIGGKIVRDEYLYVEERGGSDDGTGAVHPDEWTGLDTKGEEDSPEYLPPDALPKNDRDKEVIGPWARKQGNEIVSFDYLLSVNYIANYCNVADCVPGRPIYAGSLQPEPSMGHPLIRGMSIELPLWVFKDEDFAIVKTISGGITTEALTLDYGSNLISADGKNYSRANPMIVTSGIGERVVYYAMPPEMYANPELEKFGKVVYLLPLENMYYGIMRG